MSSALELMPQRSLYERFSRKGATAVASPFNLLGGIMPVSGTEPPVLGTRELLEGYESMPWLRAVASMVGDAVACTDWKIYVRNAPPTDEAGRAIGAGAFELTREYVAGAIATALQRTLEGRLRKVRGHLGDGIIRDRSLQRAGMEPRWKRLKALVRAKQAVEIAEHPFFDALDNPNPVLQSRHVLLKITQLHLDLVGDAFWLKERNGLGGVTGYWPVPPDWVWQLPAPGEPRYHVGWRSWQAIIPEREVVWFHEPAPSNPYTRGSGVGWALGDELEVDEYAAKMAKALFFNQARPDFVVYGFEDITEKNRLQRDWMNRTQGFWRAHMPYFMTGEPKFHEFQRPDMQQLTYPALRKNQRDIIIQTWGVPPEIFGISEHGLLAKNNYEGAEYHFGKRVVNPRADRIRGTLQREFELEFDPRGVVDFESHVADDKAFSLQVMSKAPWAWTDKEWRELADDDGGQGVHLVPLNSFATTDLTDPSQRPKGAAAGGTAPVADEKTDDDKPTDDERPAPVKP